MRNGVRQRTPACLGESFLHFVELLLLWPSEQRSFEQHELLTRALAEDQAVRCRWILV